MGAETGPLTALPPADRVLAVCAHPDDETFGLGAILSAYADAGADVTVLCLTPGEASTLGASERDLAARRASELAAAADVLGVARTRLLGYPDGALAEQPLAHLADEVHAVADDHPPDVVVTFHPDGITGHPDHQQATKAARRAADARGTPVWAWYVPAAVARRVNAEIGAAYVETAPEPGDRRVRVDRRRQRRAVTFHRSQRVSFPLVERRLQLQGPVEHLRPLTEVARGGPAPGADAPLRQASPGRDRRPR
jgi:N-acetylglucosamine malate deacetylase 2